MSQDPRIDKNNSQSDNTSLLPVQVEMQVAANNSENQHQEATSQITTTTTSMNHHHHHHQPTPCSTFPDAKTPLDMDQSSNSVVNKLPQQPSEIIDSTVTTATATTTTTIEGSSGEHPTPNPLTQTEAESQTEPQTQVQDHSEAQQDQQPLLQQEQQEETNDPESDFSDDDDDGLEKDESGNFVWPPPKKEPKPGHPAYYYPTDHPGKGCPVFEPTMEEFKDFYSYVKKIDKYGMRSGIVKVVPPKEWTESLPSVSEPLKDARLRTPISQHFNGSRGLYRQMNIAKSKVLNVCQWRQLTSNEKYQTPNFFNKDKERAQERNANAQRKQQRKARKSSLAKSTTPTPTNNAITDVKQPDDNGTKPGFEEQENAVNINNSSNDNQPHNNVSNDNHSPEKDEGMVQQNSHEQQSQLDLSQLQNDTSSQHEQQDRHNSHHDENRSNGQDQDQDRQNTVQIKQDPQYTGEQSTLTQKSPEKRKYKKLTQAERLAKTAPSDEEWANLDYNMIEHGITKDMFNPSVCHDIEKAYWRRLTFGEPPMYGADMQGSLFHDQTKYWNVAHLDDLFSRLKPKEKIPGVNTPYLYFGMWRATFAWHVEDADLYSINYIHFGAPKFWYSIPQKDHTRFERAMGGYFARDFAKCHQFIRHKSFVASPGHLANDGLRVNRMVQLPGEFILTFPHGYHAGFNMGFNCAESINFATENWIDIGRKAVPCKCVNHSVRIDIDGWLAEARGEKPPQKQSSLSSSSSKSLSPETESSRVQQDQNQTSSKKRKRSETPNNNNTKSNNNETSTKRKKTSNNTKSTSKSTENQSPQSQQEQQQTPTLKRSTKYACSLCPDPDETDLVRIPDPESNRPRVRFAHRICAIFTPATYIEKDQESGQEIVKGFENIEKARWNLKCGLCSEKHGVKIQCTKSTKCARAFHITCAFQEGSGVVIQTQEEANIQQNVQNDSNDNNGSGPSFVVLCRQHNPAWSKAQTEKKQEDLRTKVDELPIGSKVKVKSSGSVFEVILAGKIPEKDTVKVVFADGKRKDFVYKSLVWADVPTVEAPKKKEDIYVYDTVRPGQSVSRSRSHSSLAPAPLTAPTPSTSGHFYSQHYQQQPQPRQPPPPSQMQHQHHQQPYSYQHQHQAYQQPPQAYGHRHQVYNHAAHANPNIYSAQHHYPVPTNVQQSQMQQSQHLQWPSPQAQPAPYSPALPANHVPYPPPNMTAQPYYNSQPHHHPHPSYTPAPEHYVSSQCNHR